MFSCRNALVNSEGTWGLEGVYGKSKPCLSCGNEADLKGREPWYIFLISYHLLLMHGAYTTFKQHKYRENVIFDFDCRGTSRSNGRGHVAPEARTRGGET
eukprot:gb/GECG01013952.1/.p1 GENE.gb/GECG01013952.1/~~gb/GECG01013952.1/.p1  ORF type:complete len:100 (+),score=8.73 gb/GECG01013952.1/:1-300(+)